jgi:hypothetical protein
MVGQGRLRGGLWWVCGVACRGGSGFLVHSDGVGVCVCFFFFFFFTLSQTLHNIFRCIFRNATKNGKKKKKSFSLKSFAFENILH